MILTTTQVSLALGPFRTHDTCQCSKEIPMVTLGLVVRHEQFQGNISIHRLNVVQACFYLDI